MGAFLSSSEWKTHEYVATHEGAPPDGAVAIYRHRAWLEGDVLTTFRSLTNRRLASFIVAAAVTFLLLVMGSIVFSGASAQADVPETPVMEFNAPLCEGTTTNDPATAEGAVEDLTLVFGQRLIDYNAGLVVHLYGNAGTNTLTPSCATRHVDGIGAVSTWMYCTDAESRPCNTTRADGSLADASSLQPLEGNPRLTIDQQRLITYIINNELSLTYQQFGPVASNATDDSRTARQLLVWCISEQEEGTETPFCAANMNTTRQAELLSLSQETSELDFAVVGASEVNVGETVSVDVTTNIYGLPIELNTGGASVTVCDGDAVMTGNTLTVNGTGAASTVTLCVTTYTAGDVQILGTVAAPNGLDQMTWVQSESALEEPCQVFAAYQTHGRSTVDAAASIRFVATETEPSTGGFTVAKEVRGDGSEEVSVGTQFTVEYTIDGGEPKVLTVTPGGEPAAVEGLNTGDLVSFAEVNLPDIDGVTWGTPAFTVDGESTTSLIIGADTSAAVVLTNTANITPNIPNPTSTPTTAPSGATSMSESLAATGGSGADWPALTAMATLLSGVILLGLRQRQRQQASRK